MCCGCRGVRNMGSKISCHRPSASLSQIEKQLEEIELELEKYRDIRSVEKTKLETTQDYLRQCLEVAQDNGFLHLITGTKCEQQPKSPLLDSNHTVLNSQTPQQDFQPDSYLSSLIVQAKTQGWYIMPHEIELQEVVAQGTTADIYKGKWRGYDVAVKCIFPYLFESNDNMVTFFAQEVDTLSRQRHPFVLQLMGACLLPPNHGWVVTEFLNTSLKNLLHGHEGKRCKERMIPLLPFKLRLRMALEIAQAMQYLHEHNPKIIHRDLKPSNIFVDDDMHVRVADFGHARFLTDEEKALTGETGTYIYMAPEIIQSAPYDEKCDVYSFGIILNELVTGDQPYIETDYGPSRIAMEVAKNGLRPMLPSRQCAELEEIIALIQHLWDEDAAARPSFATITLILTKFHGKLPDAA